MEVGNHPQHINKVTAGGLLVALGIIYGDIGTSPLYVMEALIKETKQNIDPTVVLGALSCVFWTLTLQTTLKYVILILRADNRGEGGIFALYALVRRHAKWLTIPAMIGGATLLADGIITPPISISSAIEGLRAIYPDIETVPIVITILTFLFLIQVFGTSTIGKAFGPIMSIWFGMLATFGAIWIAKDVSIIRAINPVYAYRLLAEYPHGFWLLGAVFLCTTGAEALYSDLGHCGRGNIRVSWVFVKICLILQYFGQGNWLIAHAGEALNGRKPIYELMPEWFLIIGILIATSAAVIASQALITGSFTLISEAIRLNFWPKVQIRYPSLQKGQIYVSSVNWLLYAGCVGIVLYFRESGKMEAAYGLAITLTMLMTTLLMSYYLYVKRFAPWGVVLFLVVYITLEGGFLVANLAKFAHGGWVSLLISGVIISVMVIWYNSFYIKQSLTEYVKLDRYIDDLKALSSDFTIPKYATHLVFMSNASRLTEIESKVIYSIFEKRPKRADIYWFVHVEITDEPYSMEYKVHILEPDDVIKINFYLGFRVEQKINLYLRKVIEEMVKNKEVDVTSRYESFNKQNRIGDFRFVVLEKYLSIENDLSLFEQVIMKAHFFIKNFIPGEDKWFGLEASAVKIEKVPLVIQPVESVHLKRRY
ncbi:KUP/HAK/KT family potassium transporter [Runella sp.]|jgi:KUP system potassium uptake protein|uniref:KUP/HAK/KT family potassium transporter n=1 Tax=Runella sp. TaxID=1960881 RepID=UPI0026316918|nr:KUP/HAK/KT family potassium transporter [Runella sp.]